jgi:hypothetical protein
LNISLNALREMFGIDIAALKKLYAREKKRVPDTKESARLPL